MNAAARNLLAEIYGWFTGTSAGGLRSAGTSAGPVLRSPAEGGGLPECGRL
jgi:hypothetical protein